MGLTVFCASEWALFVCRSTNSRKSNLGNEDTKVNRRRSNDQCYRLQLKLIELQ